MRLDSARDLKRSLLQSIVVPMAASATLRAAGLRAVRMTDLAATPPSIAVGVARRRRGDYVVAVRLQKRGIEDSPEIERIRRRAGRELEVRFVGAVAKRAGPPWFQKRVRPLRIGASCGHFRITAGTLGGFVRDRRTGRDLILSNNHVLADENRGRKGDAIVQPGAFDGGRATADRVGTLLRFHRLDRDGVNRVDAAVAGVVDGTRFDPATIPGIGTVAGLAGPVSDDGAIVAKVGRTTGLRRGRITAFELDHVTVGYDMGVIRFDDQIEIEGADDASFSEGGDSGALIVTEDRLAAAQLFAGSTVGGSNGRGLTYATPIAAVLDALGVDLLLDGQTVARPP